MTNTKSISPFKIPKKTQIKTVTSFFAIKDDLVNAGALWEDGEVVVDGNMVTSRTPNDLPAFMRAIIAATR